MMEAERMAHLTLQIGAAIIVPVGPRRRHGRAGDWRSGRYGKRRCYKPRPQRGPPRHVLAARVHGLKIGRALSSVDGAS